MFKKGHRKTTGKKTGKNDTKIWDLEKPMKFREDKRKYSL
jgi:hypothetical protein